MIKRTTGLPLRRLLAMVCLVLTLAACASSAPRQGMYWGNYETGLYRLVDAPNDRVQQQHLSNLRQVVSVSNDRGWRPPPGAMLELAMLEQQMGNSDAYALLVNREYHLYPESRLYIQRWFSDVIVTEQGAEEDNSVDDLTGNDLAPQDADQTDPGNGGNDQ